MPAIQSLKKQLRGIRSTQKLTKAMKTISTVKFSQLNGIYAGYAEYGDQCRKIFRRFGTGLLDAVREADSTAPPVVIVIASNKGLCGNFNAEILNYARDTLPQFDAARLVACGKKAVSYFSGKGIPVEKACIFSDIPTYGESSALLDEILEWRSAGKASRVYVIYPEYVNMMNQSPVMIELFSADPAENGDLTLFVPDRDAVVQGTAKTVFHAMFYKLVLESALGAQAATLLTMRSAFDTATEYCAQLEGQINRMRQSAVTADVIETSVEWTED